MKYYISHSDKSNKKKRMEKIEAVERRMVNGGRVLSDEREKS